MLKLDAKFPKDLESFDIVGELQNNLQSFSGSIDAKLLTDFQKEYELKRKYYRKIRNIKKLPNEHTFLVSDGNVGLWRLMEEPEKRTSQRDVKVRERKRVRIIRGKKKGTLSKSYFYVKRGVHNKKDKWYVKKPESLEEFFSERVDKITERTLHE